MAMCDWKELPDEDKAECKSCAQEHETKHSSSDTALHEHDVQGCEYESHPDVAEKEALAGK